MPAETMRFHARYQISFVEQRPPRNFCLKELVMLQDYIFKELLELHDFIRDIKSTPKTTEHSAQYMYFYPRFISRADPSAFNAPQLSPGNCNITLLPTKELLKYLKKSSKKIVHSKDVPILRGLDQSEWNEFVEPYRGQLLIHPGARPSTIRCDQIDRQISISELGIGNNSREDEEIDRKLAELSDYEDDGDKVNKNFKTDIDGNIDTRWWQDRKITKDLKTSLSKRYKTVHGHTPLHPDRVHLPVIVHHGVRPANLSYAGDPRYQKVWKSYLKLKHLNMNKPDLSEADRKKEKHREHILNLIRKRSDLKKETVSVVSIEGFYSTGLKSDVASWALLLPVVSHHIRFQKCLAKLESILDYRFENRLWLTSALTHPSFQLNFGWNADHVRNSLNNCGLRNASYGELSREMGSHRKKGITTLIKVMAKMGKQRFALSPIDHNERLEYLGDSVLGFMVSEALFRLFPNFSEGSLSILRTSIVQNYNLAKLSRKVNLNHFMLYAHGLSKDADIDTAMANCFEAILGALYIDGGLDQAKKFLTSTMFWEEETHSLRDIWTNLPSHPLQEEEPGNDRHHIQRHAILQNLVPFEDQIGYKFRHIRLLARSVTNRSAKEIVAITGGNNQRLEFLGDSLCSLLVSDYLFRHYPFHHEGHLTVSKVFRVL